MAKAGDNNDHDLRLLQHALAYELLAAETPSAVAEQTLRFIIQATDSDGGVFGVSRTGRPEDYDWHVLGVPKKFLEDYANHSDADFIRRTTAAAPNKVLLDRNMVSLRELHGNHFIQSSSDYHFPIRRVMGVIPANIGFKEGGIALYRTRGKQFSEGERARMQAMVETFACRMRSVHKLSCLRANALAFRAMAGIGRRGTLLVNKSMILAHIDATAQGILADWLPLHGRNISTIVPEKIAAGVRATRASPATLHTWRVASRSGELEEHHLEAECIGLEGMNEPQLWHVTLTEVVEQRMPLDWRTKLAPTECDVVERVLLGWPNRLIAEELTISEAAVKKRLQRTYDKVGVCNRATMICMALQLK